MTLRNEPLAWQFDSNDPYLPVYYEGAIAGFFKQEYADRIVGFLNDEERLNKALRRACIDLIRKSGGDTSKVELLMNKYLTMTERPKYGTRAIAVLLLERQQELDLSNQEFAKFCNTFKISQNELNNIFSGEPVDDSWLIPLSRILGISTTELLEVRDGSSKEVT